MSLKVYQDFKGTTILFKDSAKWMKWIFEGSKKDYGLCFPLFSSHSSIVRLGNWQTIIDHTIQDPKKETTYACNK